jgi:hypothetical protein
MPVLEKLRQEDYEFKMSLVYMVNETCLKKTKRKQKTRKDNEVLATGLKF